MAKIGGVIMGCRPGQFLPPRDGRVSSSLELRASHAGAFGGSASAMFRQVYPETRGQVSTEGEVSAPQGPSKVR